MSDGLVLFTLDCRVSVATPVTPAIQSRKVFPTTLRQRAQYDPTRCPMKEILPLTLKLSSLLFEVL